MSGALEKLLKDFGLDEDDWRDKFRFQKKDAVSRGIPFLFEFEEWLQFWADSGHIHERGCRKGKYVMARFGDKGPYQIGNVRICTVEENAAELWSRPEHVALVRAVHKNKVVSKATREKVRKARLGSKASPETRAKMSKSRMGNQNAKGNRAWLGRKHSEETKEKIRQINLGKKHPPEVGQRTSERLKGNQYALGLVHSEESRKQMSESQKKRWAQRRAEREFNSMSPY